MPSRIFDVGSVIFHHHVGACHQFVEYLQSRCFFQIEGERSFVAMQVLEIGAVPVAGEPPLAVKGGRDLDLYDVGAPICKLAHAGGTGTNPCQIQDGDIGQNRRGRCMWHFDNAPL